MALFPTTTHAKPVDKAKPYVLSVSSGNAGHEDSVELEEEISVTIVNVGQLVNEARQSGKRIILFFDHMPLKGIYTSSYTSSNDKDELHFFISHTDEPIAVWNHFVFTRKKGELFTRKVSVSVGLEDQDAIPTLVKDNNAFTLVLVKKSWFTVSVFIIAALFVLFMTLAVKSDILRNVGPSPDTGRKPYSLALVQMATWFFVIMTSWVLLYVVKHTFNTITDTLVILMGISAGTGIGGIAIDSNRDKFSKTVARFFEGYPVGRLWNQLSPVPDFSWTIVMVAVFIRQVTAYMTMPNFDSSLLILMGISSGTYLGFKVTEKTAEKAKDSE